MPILEVKQTWTFTGSTGAGKAVRVSPSARNLTFGAETSSGCTGTVQWLHRMGSSAGPYSVLASTALSSGQFWTVQNNGPLEYVKPNLVSITAGGTTNVIQAYLIGN